MQTVRQMERFWNARQYSRLFRELIGFRPEASIAAQLDFASPGAPAAVPAAAMALIRLEELAQTHLAFYRTLLNTVLAAQDCDGGWDSPMLTALCVRALMASNGGGSALERALAYLANLQKPQGIWPRIPIRRTEADVVASLFILYHLGSEPRFRDAVDFDAAMTWFAGQVETMDRATQKIWTRIELRCGSMPVMHQPLGMIPAMQAEPTPLRASA